MTDISELIGPLKAPGLNEFRTIVVSTITGSTTINGTSGEMGNSTDTKLLLGLREWSDVVLVGSSTVRAEDYAGVKVNSDVQNGRIAGGQRPIPPIAVLSSSLNFDAATRFFSEAEVSPLIFTDNDNAKKIAELERAGATVVQLEGMDVGAVVEKLHSMGFARIACEGGANLFGQVLAAGLVDVWHHTIDPTLSASVERPVVVGKSPAPLRAELEHSYICPDSTLFLRYRIV